MGIIKYASQIIDVNINQKIDFINIVCGCLKFQMTLQKYEDTTYIKYMQQYLPLKMYNYVQNTHNNLEILVITQSLCYKYSGDGDSRIFANIFNNEFSKAMMHYLTEFKFDGYSNDNRIAEIIK